jgi:hypothetical protein
VGRVWRVHLWRAVQRVVRSHRMRRLEPSKWKFALSLVGLSILFAALHFIENLVSNGVATREGITWVGVLRFVGFSMVLFWFGAFVVWSRVERQFGKWRRPLNGAVLGIIAVALIWLHQRSIELVPWSVIAIAFVIGCVAEFWVEGL